MIKGATISLLSISFFVDLRNFVNQLCCAHHCDVLIDEHDLEGLKGSLAHIIGHVNLIDQLEKVANIF